MAMHAGQIAKLAHVDLQNLRASAAKRKGTVGKRLGKPIHLQVTSNRSFHNSREVHIILWLLREEQKNTRTGLCRFFMKKCAAEFIGTFVLVFAGTGAIIINEASGGAITHVGIALTFGLVVLAMIYTVGDISGAHLNPAVSLGFLAARRFPLHCVIPYIVSQCAGAFAASGILRFLFPKDATLGATLP